MKELITSEITQKQRLDRANLWLRSLDGIRRELPEGKIRQEVTTAEQFAISKLRVGRPKASSDGEVHAISVPLLEDGSSPPAAIVPLFIADLALSNYYKNITSPSYRELSRSIFLPPCNINDKWRGLVLFHEVRHVMNHVEQNFRDTSDGTWLEEVAIYESEQAIMDHVFDGYSTLVDSALDGLSQYSPDDPKANYSTAINKLPWQDVFPKPRSKLETNMAHGVLLLNVAYRDIDMITKDSSTANHRKAMWTKRFYGKNEPSISASSPTNTANPTIVV